MIRFATEIPLHAALQPRDLLQHARTWLVGSQHHAVTEEDMRWPLDGELVEEVYRAGNATVPPGRYERQIAAVN